MDQPAGPASPILDAEEPPRFKIPFWYEDGRIVDDEGALVAECSLAPGAPAAAGEHMAEALAEYWEAEGLAFEEEPEPETPAQRRMRRTFQWMVGLILAALVADRFWPFLPAVGAAG
jgi:hypothetical protein